MGPAKTEGNRPEPWLRGTLTEMDAVRRQVLHALELAEEDLSRLCEGLSESEIHARPFGVASVAYHLRHIVRSLDRLLTYTEGRQLGEAQFAALQAELVGQGDRDELLREFTSGVADAGARVAAIPWESYEQARGVGRQMLPTTVGGLLVHCAEHTQRHVGQAVTTAKVVVGMRGSP